MTRLDSGTRWRRPVSRNLHCVHLRAAPAQNDITHGVILPVTCGQDYEKTRIGQTIGLRWVFADSPMTLDHIVENMQAALDGVRADLVAGKTPKVAGYSVNTCDFIKSRLRTVVVKIKP